MKNNIQEKIKCKYSAVKKQPVLQMKHTQRKVHAFYFMAIKNKNLSIRVSKL
jgi:hypothetical protein